MAAPSTQSPPLGLPSDATAFLQDTLRPNYGPVSPVVADYGSYLNQGLNVGSQIDSAILSGLHAQQAKQAIAASQAQAELAAARSPYDLALIQARTQAIPLDQKYNAALQQGKLDEMEANAAKRRAQAAGYNSQAPVVEPFLPPSAQASPSVPYQNNFQLDTSLPASDFTLDGGDDEQQSSLLSSNTLPAFDDTPIPGTTDNLVAVSGAENPATAKVYNSTQGNTFTARATGYHPVSSDSPDYRMEGGNQDAQGNPIHTLDAYRRGDVPDVTVAVDRSSPLFGQTGYSPDLNAPVKFTDTGSAFKGKGTSRVDVARDTAAGANSDENNGNLTFQVGAGAGGSGGDDAAGDSVDTQSAASGVRVPTSMDELTAQRNYANGWITRQTALLSQTNNPRQQTAIKTQIADVQNALNRSEQIYLSSQRNGRNTLSSGSGLDALQDIDGYQKDDIRNTGGKLSARYVSNAQAAQEQQRQVASDISTYVGPGTTVDDFLAATPIPGTSNWKVTHNHTDPQGLVVPIETTISDRVHRTLLPSVDRAFPGQQSAPATNTTRSLPTVDPVHLVLGRRVTAPGASDALPVVTQPAVSTQSLLAQAANRLPDSDDPLEQLGRNASDATTPGSPVRLPGEQAIALGNEQVTATQKSKAAAMQRQIAAATFDYNRQRATTQDVQDGLNPYTGGAPYSLLDKANASDQLRQARVRLQAAQDPDNYSVAADGSYVYNDPYRVNSAMTGQTATVGGVTTTRRMTN